MYLRTTSRRNTDGSVVRYVQLAHNHWVEGVTQAQVLLNLGREDKLDPDGLRRLVASINRYLGEPAAGQDVREAVGDALTVTDARPLGAVWLLDGLWRQLGVDTALRQVLGGRRFTTDVERVLFALVANRAVDPCSKLAAAEWASYDTAIPRLTSMDEDQAYRAMDLLIEADAQAQVQEAVFFAVADLLNLEVDLLFFDTTSTYFERDTEEAPDQERPEGWLRRYGHSKDSRPRSAADRDRAGRHPRRHPGALLGLAGNTADVAVLPEVKDDLQGWRLGRVVTVVDRGFSSKSNLEYLRRAGGHWIAGERMRDGNAQAQAALSRQGRYRAVRDNLRVKEVTLDGDSGVRWIVCHNPHEAERDAARRTEALERLGAELDRIKQARVRDAQRRQAGKKAPADDVHVRAECALRDHPTLGRWLRQLPSGRLVLDKKKIAAEERLDGKYLLSTSDPDLSAEDVALGYKNLLEAERGFRDLKSTLDLRPVFHRVEPRIRAHVLLCWLALLLIRVAERRTGLTWRRIEIELGRLHAVTLSGTAGTVVQTTPLNEVQAGILRACQVTPPPRVTTLHPA
jgi:hypothetical protein